MGGSFAGPSRKIANSETRVVARYQATRSLSHLVWIPRIAPELSGEGLVDLESALTSTLSIGILARSVVTWDLPSRPAPISQGNSVCQDGSANCPKLKVTVDGDSDQLLNEPIVSVLIGIEPKMPAGIGERD
jgi:hypothetical protein